MQCEMRFPVDGSTEMEFGKGLSLGSLMSALAYESNSAMQSSLDHFFPGWKLMHSRIASGAESRQTDWTTPVSSMPTSATQCP